MKIGIRQGEWYFQEVIEVVLLRENFRVHFYPNHVISAHSAGIETIIEEYTVAVGQQLFNHNSILQTGSNYASNYGKRIREIHFRNILEGETQVYFSTSRFFIDVILFDSYQIRSHHSFRYSLVNHHQLL